MAEQKNEIVKTFDDKLNDNLLSVTSALPKDFNRMRFVQNAMAVVTSNPDIMKCKQSEIMAGLLKGAYLGLDFANKECYLIPYGNTLNFQTDYKGEIKFTKRYSIRPIKDIYAKVVRKGDDFTEKIVDGHPSIDFNPVPFNDDEIVGAFAVCLFEDCGMLYEAMSNKDIQSVRNNYSKASQSKAWKCSYDEMCKKVVLRRLCKHIETDFESIEAQNAWEESAGMEFTSTQKFKKSEVVNAFAPKEETENEENIIEGTAIEINENDLPDFMKGE